MNIRALRNVVFQGVRKAFRNAVRNHVSRRCRAHSISSPGNVRNVLRKALREGLAKCIAEGYGSGAMMHKGDGMAKTT